MHDILYRFSAITNGASWPGKGWGSWALLLNFQPPSVHIFSPSPQGSITPPPGLGFCNILAISSFCAIKCIRPCIFTWKFKPIYWHTPLPRGLWSDQSTPCCFSGNSYSVSRYVIIIIIIIIIDERISVAFSAMQAHMKQWRKTIDQPRR